MSPPTREGPGTDSPDLSNTLFATNSKSQSTAQDDGRRPCDRCGKLALRKIRVGGRSVYRHSWCGDGPDYRLEGPETSVVAAAENRPRRDTQKWLVLQALIARPDATDFELAADVRLRENSVAKRRLELQRLGFVEATGRHRPAPSGAKAMVWKVTAAGVSYWRGMAS